MKLFLITLSNITGGMLIAIASPDDARTIIILAGVAFLVFAWYHIGKAAPKDKI